MRSITLLSFFLAASLASFASAGDLKVGTIDLQKVFKAYPGYDIAQAKFKAIAEKKQKELSEPEQELGDLQKELESSASIMSAKEKRRKTDTYKKLLQDYSQQKSDIQNFLAKSENDMTMSLLDDIKVVVADVAKDQGVGLVMDSEKIVYVKDGLDLTEAVLKKFKTVKVKDDDSK